MHSLKEIQMKCNRKFTINFDGGELSSDGGLLIIKEFLHTLGIEKLLKDSFKTTSTLAYGDAGHPVFAIFSTVSLMLLALT